MLGSCYVHLSNTNLIDEFLTLLITILQLWYALAKTLSEQAAWALAMDRMLCMVSINAGLVLGPGVTQQNPRSTMFYLKGNGYMQHPLLTAQNLPQALLNLYAD